MRKRLSKPTALALALILLLTLLPGAALAENELWVTKTLDDGTLAITGYRGLASAIEIPSSIDGVAVTRIGSSAFRNSDFLVSVVIPSSVTTIEYEAFCGCSALVTADLTEGLCELHNRAFGNCALTHIYIPATLKTLHASNTGDAPFAGCASLDAVTFAQGITELPYSLLRGCTGLTSIDIPNTVTTIGDYAFQGCTNLSSVRIPDSVETIGNSAFLGCAALAELSIPDSVTSVGNGAFQDCTGLTTLSVPGSVASIGYAAFNGCTGLTSVELSEGLVTLGAQAFRGCTGLTGIYIPSTLKNVSASNSGDGVFYGCTALTSVTFSPELTAIPYSLLRGCPGLTSLTIPDTVNKIGEYAFAGCTGLKTVRISSSLAAIPGHAFAGCTALSSVKIPDGVTSIGSGAFVGCSALTSVSVPGSVTLIDGAAFANCTSLTTVKLSEGLRSMGTAVFKGCTSLKSINIPASLTYIGASNADDGSFRDCPALETLALSPEATTIPQNLLRGCQSVTYLRIPATVKTIGGYAFNTCLGLADIYYGAGETSWAAITVQGGNGALNDVTVHYSAPGAVAEVTAAAEGDKVVVRWGAAPGAVQFIIQRRLKGEDAWTTLKSNAEGDSYADTTGEAGVIYQYRVRGRDLSLYGPFRVSGVVRFPAAVPGAIDSVLAVASAGKTVVSWAAAANAGAYIIQRRVKDDDVWTTLKSNVTGTSYEDATGVAGTVYQYRVRGRDGTSYGPFKVSSVVRAIAGSTSSAPGAISGVTATAMSAGKTMVSWTASSGATAYIVQRRVKDSDSWTTLKSNVTGLSYIDTTGVAGTVYQYRVRGRNGTVYGPFKVSSVVRAK